MRADQGIIDLQTLETNRHLFQQPLYYNGSDWDDDFISSTTTMSQPIKWEPAAFTSFCSFGYFAGDLTPVTGVTRRPWLSEVEDSAAALSDIPPHGRTWMEPGAIANELKSRLSTEAENACKDFDEIYILLSGGLDSRIVAGTMAGLVSQRVIKRPPTAVTWGSKNSRDVVYAKYISEMLGFPWVHLTLTERDVAKNIRLMADKVGAASSPTHLHRMDWFSQFENNVLVLAGSYGDSVGRSEFSGRIVLELDYLRPRNYFGLMRDEAFAQGADTLEQELERFKERAGDRPKYAVCELERQGHYMRGMIAHVMSIIGQSTNLYQMFTAPEVYSFMWSLHPAARTDQVYTELLTQIDPRLARVPWARTNRPLRGKALFHDATATRQYHQYMDWTAGPLWDELMGLIEPDWFHQTGLIDPERLNQILDDLSGGKLRHYGIRPHETIAWLASIRCLADKIEANVGKKVEPVVASNGSTSQIRTVTDDRTAIRRRLSRFPFVQRTASRLRRSTLRKASLRTYPISNKLSKD